MRVIIVEDETAAVTNLRHILTQIDQSIEILEVIDSVSDAVLWFNSNSMPDLVFMDIHLSDADAFKIFEQTDIAAPVIFTTAYDQYALEAFKVNSIDYILKPIRSTDIERALNKFKHLTSPETKDYIDNQNRLVHKSITFLIPMRDTIIPLKSSDVMFFYSTNEQVQAYTIDKQYPIDKSLENISKNLDDRDFYRVNRQFLINRKAIDFLSIWIGNRLKINTSIPTPEKIIVSKARVADFKKWFKSQGV